MKHTIIYFCIVSIISIICTIADKSAAIKHKHRIPERTLIILGLCGGAMAMYLTMRVISHKTRRAKFMIGLPIIAALHLIILAVASFALTHR